MGAEGLLGVTDPVEALRLLTRVSSGALYMGRDDNLRVTSYNALAAVRVQARWRVLPIDGPAVASADSHVANTDRTAKSSVFITPEGWLLGGEVFVSGAAPLIGQTFVVVELVRGSTGDVQPLQIIAAGYISAKQPLLIPAASIGSSVQGAGAIRSITGTNPAAGAEISETVPTGARWLLRGFTAALVTNATVATRRVALLLDDGAATLIALQATDGQAASLTRSYSGPNVGSYVVAQTSTLGLPFQQGIPLIAGARIRTVTANLDPGDDWGAPQLLVEEFIEGA